MRAVAIHTTTSSKKEAKKLAKRLCKKGLAACVQIHPTQSMYQWNGMFCNEQEFAMIIKTRKKHYKSVKKYLLKHHSYETPQIYKYTLDKPHKAYLQWIYDTTK